MKRFAVSLLSFMVLAGCGNSVSFKQAPETASGELGELFFPLEITKDYQKLNKYDVNETSVVFQVFDDSNNSVKGLKASDFKITENGVGLTDYLVIDKTQNTGRKADIVFVLDITASMDPYIQKVKDEVTKFVDDLKKEKIIANLCLVTFKDDVVDKCNMFVEDDPNTTKNENLDDFLTKVNALDASGGGDNPENQLLGLEVAAAVTPWHTGAQRLSVLITDQSFHYAPDNKGDAGNKAPTYEHTLNTVTDYHMQVFAVGPSIDGYKTDFKKMPSLTKASDGMWFDFNGLSGSGGSLKRIFDAIIDTVSTTYTLQFISEKNPGLDPSLGLDKREIVIADNNGTRNYRVKAMKPDSTQPNGRPPYPTKFKLRGKVRKENAIVTINGQQITKGFEFEDDELHFDQPPPSEAEVTIQYYLSDLKETLKVRQVKVPRAKTSKYKLSVIANGIDFTNEDYEYNEVDGASSVVILKGRVFDESDPFQVFLNRGLRFKINFEKVKVDGK